MPGKNLGWIALVAMLSLVGSGCKDSDPKDRCAGVDCSDGVACTQDSCDQATGDCSHSPDDSACATTETCDAVEGCVAIPCSDDSDCDDGLYCSGSEACEDGSCSSGTAVDCDDGVACTVDSCDESAQACDNTPDDGLCGVDETCDPVAGCQGSAECTVDGDCEDGLVCNGSETCDAGSCADGTPPACDDGVACTEDQCSEGAQGCEYLPDHGLCPAGELCDPTGGCQVVGCTDDIDCDDGFFCNGAETCTAGACEMGTAVACDDSIACTVDACDETAEACVFTPDDGLCSGGEICDPAQGGCTTAPCSTDADCDDGVLCNGAEVCNAGACEAGAAADCDDGVDCTVDSCDVVSDACDHLPDHGLCQAGELCDPVAGCQATVCTEDVDCDDGLYCNGSEVCNAGACEAGVVVDCDDGVACTIDQCDEAATACVNTADDGQCDNGLYCDGAEFCDLGMGCQAGMGVNCDDGVSCTADSCDEVAGQCVNAPDDASCDNGLFCDGVEVCDPFADCQPGAGVPCDDGVGCTIDSCDEAAGSCVNSPDDGMCDDADMCNGVETCDPAMDCQPGTPMDCDDGSACTLDECIADTCVNTPDDLLCDDGNACTVGMCNTMVDPPACLYSPEPPGTSCSDGNVCNGDEVCLNGMCRAGSPLICTDDSPCTNNYCSPGAGCIAELEPVGTPCPDGDLCNGDETCDVVGACLPGTPLDCDDGNPCTDDFCLGSDGCIQADNMDPCDDLDPCTANDRCVAGVCAGVSLEICGDGIDNDCDGVTDPDPPCQGDIGTWVAPPPFGNDANPGTQTQPVATVTAGIANALLIGTPQVVYVAGDPAYFYNEDLVMFPGVSVYGGYSSDGLWDYDPATFPTILAPTDPEGVKFFNTAIDNSTVLDGVYVVGLDAGGMNSATSGVTVRGCGPTISNTTVFGGGAGFSTAVTVESGAAPLLTSAAVFGGDARNGSYGIWLEGSDLDLVFSTVFGGTGPTVVGVSLTDAGDVSVRQNQISGGAADGGAANPFGIAVGLLSSGPLSSLLVEQNAIAGGTSIGTIAWTAGVRLEDCGGGSVMLLNNPFIVGGPAIAFTDVGQSAGVSIDGDCPAQITDNDMIMGSNEQTEAAIGLICGRGAACLVEYNGLIVGTGEFGATVSAGGVSCDAGACASISFNQAVAGGDAPNVMGMGLGAGTAPVVDSNLIFAGNCPNSGIMASNAVGLFLSGSGAEVVNNQILGGSCVSSQGIGLDNVPSVGGLPMQPNVNCNYVHGFGTFNLPFAFSVGIGLDGADAGLPTGDFRNNIVNAGFAPERLGVAEFAFGADPRTFDYNDVVGATLALYLDESQVQLQTIAEVNALVDMQTGSNLSVYPDLVNEAPFGDLHLNPGSPLIDAGTTDGAPDHDFEGESRPAGLGFDIGLDEAP